MLAELVVDHMAWLGRRIVAQGQVDATAVQFRLAPSQGGVGLFGFAVMKLTGQFAVGIGVPREQDDPRGFPIQSMDDSGLWVAVFLQARSKSVV